MKKLYIILSLLMSFTAFAQVEFLVEIDAETGDWVKIDSIESVAWISTSNASFDPISKQYIFVGSDPSFEWKLFSLDVNDVPDPTEMEIASSPLWPDIDVGDNMHSIETDQGTGISYALHWDASETTEYLVSIDRASGTYELVCEMSEILYVYVGGTYNSETQVYSFRGKTATDPWALYSVDVTTGLVISNPEFPVLEDDSDNINFIQYNAEGELFGLHWDNSEGTEYFVSIDPSTGVHEIIASIPGVELITGGGVFDELNNRYTFLGKGFLDPMLQLITLDAVTGEILSNPDFPILEDVTDNIVELQYDNATGILYGLHWDADLICPESFSEISVSSCDSYISPSGAYEWVESGIYTDTLSNFAGCDSIITIDVSITTIDTSVTVGIDDLTSNELEATYQWVDCNKLLTAIDGATDQTFIAEESGSYAVIITKGECIDTSICYDLCLTTYQEISITACDSYVSPSGMYEWTESGMFADTIVNIAGCDSIISIDLTIKTIDTTITGDPLSLTSNEDGDGVSYQWIDCNMEMAAIDGATDLVFTPEENGSYAVIITNGECIDTSVCVDFCLNTYNEISMTACEPYISPSGIYEWTESGIFTDTILNIAGCDSIITIDLTITTMDTTVTSGPFSLTSNEDAVGASYQWLDCNQEMAAIDGATDQVFIADENGSYAVIITNGACIDTSACIEIMALSIDHETNLSDLQIYPNPSSGPLNIAFSTSYENDIIISIKDISGKTVHHEVYQASKIISINPQLAAGAYYVQISSKNNKTALQKILIIR